jgi:putative zinc finger/helix-turn-helix YgiT family protein
MEETPMKCMKCGHAMRIGRENIPDSDLPGVVLVDVTVNRCSSCGAWEVEIPHHVDLTKELARFVISKRGRLSKEEVRFLRACLYDNAADFARVIGHDASTISRWENGVQQIGRHAELLLRLMVAHEKRIDAYPIDKLKDVAIEDTRKPVNARMTFDGSHWSALPAGLRRKPPVRARRKRTAAVSPRRARG